MPCQLKTFSHYVDELLQIWQFQDVCVNGLQVEGKNTLKHIVTSVTASLKTVKKAVRMKADALLVHHGLFLKNKDVQVASVLREKLKLLIENNISLFAYHLPLDAHLELGNNWAAAKWLGWTDLAPFGIYQGRAVGVQGTIAPIERKKFKSQVERFYGHQAHVAFGGPKVIKSCALISGGAHKWIDEAVKARVDCFITGSFDEPVWNTAFEEKINFMALGHAATEKIGVQLLGNHLADEFQLVHTFIDDENPF
jgi:dinuclear metal center YbgI/SA1388 family protein